MISIPPKWLREKMAKDEPLTKGESEWLEREVLLHRSKEELIKIIVDLRSEKK